MVKIETLSNWIYLHEGCEVRSLTCNTISDEFVFMQDPDASPYKIYQIKNYVRIRTPKLLEGLIGKEVVQYTQYVDPLPNELFRIKPMSSIKEKHKYPYFTLSTLVLPWFYISQALDETAQICRISFNLTDPSIIKMGQIRAEVTLVKKGELWNYPLYKTYNGLTTKPVKHLIGAVRERDLTLRDFSYLGTLGYERNKFGVIVFKENQYE